VIKAVIIGTGRGGEGKAGCHSIGYAHAEAMRRSGGKVVLAAASTRTPANAATFSAEYPEATIYADYREMLAAEKPDMVSVCAFPGAREEMVMAALEWGAKIVWAEKPFATSSASAHRMVDAAKAHGARIVVGFQRRYGAPFEAAQKAIDDGRIGKLRSVSIVHPGMGFIDFGPHLMDTAIGWLSPAKPAAAFAAIQWAPDQRHQGDPVEQQLLGTVHFDNGARLIVESGAQVASRSPILRADGDRGFLELLLAPEPGENAFLRGASMDSGAISGAETNENFHHGTVDTNLYFDRMLLDVAQAHETGAATRVDAENALTGVGIMEAWTRSARENRVVGWPL
jgi:UDP-N-acetylglucosamine 3-dehydrogenase